MATRRLFLKLIGNVAAHDALGEAFDDGRLSDAGLADEHGIVLGAAAEHLHHAADLVFPADHWVELALAGGFGEIVRVAFERLIFRLGILVGDALRAAYRDQRLKDGVVGGAGLIEKLAGWVAALYGDREQQMLGGDELVFKALGFIGRALQNLVERRREIHAGLHAAGFRQGLELVASLGDDGVGMDAAFFENRADDTFLLFGQSQQQVKRIHYLAAVLPGDLLGKLQGLLGLLGEFV